MDDGVPSTEYIAASGLGSLGNVIPGIGRTWGGSFVASCALQPQVAQDLAKSKQQAEQKELKQKQKQTQAATAATTSSSSMQPRALAMVPVASPAKARVE